MLPLADRWRAYRQTCRDLSLWARAETLADLGELTARWLEGGIAAHPGYCAPHPDPETESLIPVLAKVNRAGFVTSCSQPGYAENGCEDDPGGAQRAAVDGFASEADARTLEDAARAAGLWVATARSRPWWRRDRGAWIDVSTEDGCPVTGFGGQRSTRNVRFCYRGCGRRAVRALLSAVQVTVVDPEFADNDRLWRMLDQWAQRPTAGERSALHPSHV